MSWTVAPWDLTAFVGRDAERAVLRGMARGRTDEPALATLYGIAGAGKTRLARIAAADLADDTPGGRVFASVDDGPAGLADALGAGPGDDPVESAARALTLRERSLIVLDHTGTAPDAIGAALPAWLSSGAHVFLVVARAPLEVRGARRIAVGALAPADALALLTLRLAELGAGPADPVAAARLVAVVGGLPLAIELLAGGLRTRSVDEVERALAGGGALLATDRDVPERHRSLERALDETWSALDAAEQLALAIAGAFDGPFRAGEVDAVAGAFAGAAPIDRLVTRGLVVRADDHLEVPACLRRFARERTPADTGCRIAAAHATAALSAPEDPQVARLLTAGYALASTSDEADLAVRALLAAARGLERRGGDLPARTAAVARACDTADRAGLARRIAEARIAAADLARSTGDTAAARAELDRATAAALRDPDGGAALGAEIAIVEAQLAIDRGDAAAALAQLDRAVAAAPVGHVRARALAARFTWRLVQVTPADETDGAAALDAFRALGDERRVAQALTNLGLAALHRGDLTLAGERLAAARIAARRAGDAVVQCGASLFAGLVELDRARPAAAAAHLAHAEALALDLGRFSLWSDAVGYGALARLEAGDPTAAAALASHVSELTARGLPGSAPLFAAALHVIDPALALPPPPPSDRRPLIDQAVRILAGARDATEGGPAPQGVQLRIAQRLRRRVAGPEPTARRDVLSVTRGPFVLFPRRRVGRPLTPRSAAPHLRRAGGSPRGAPRPRHRRRAHRGRVAR